MAWFQLLTLIFAIKGKNAMQHFLKRMAKILLPSRIEWSAACNLHINSIASWNKNQPQDKLSQSQTNFGCSIFLCPVGTAQSWFYKILVTPAAFRARIRVSGPPHYLWSKAKAEIILPRRPVTSISDESYSGTNLRTTTNADVFMVLSLVSGSGQVKRSNAHCTATPPLLKSPPTP